MPEAVNIIGEKGGGKTLFAAFRACQVREEYPWCKVVENIGINVKGCYHVSDILRTIAVKIILKDRTPMEFIIDEAALSGLEARDSHGLGSAIRSYLLALSRKTNSNMWLITQMMSMIEKRGQWLSDYDMLCEAHYETPASYELHIPDYFEYSIYNQNRVKTNELNLYGVDALKLFPLYDTNAVPNEDGLAQEFIQFFQIGDPDISDFCKMASMNSEKMRLAKERFRQIKDSLSPENESLAQRLGPWYDQLEFSPDGQYVTMKKDPKGKTSKTKWSIFHTELKEDGYQYVPAEKGGPKWYKEIRAE